MRRCLFVFALAVVALAGCAGAAEPELKTDAEKTLYALGLVMGGNIQNYHMSPREFECLKAGLADAYLKKTPRVDLNEWRPKVAELARDRKAAYIAERTRQSHELLERAVREKGAVRTEGGVVVETLAPGTGAVPGAEDRVQVRWFAMLIDGTEVQGTREEPIGGNFSVATAQPCWKEGIQRMKVGGKAKIYCPPELTDQTVPIDPGGSFVWEVELIGILPRDVPEAR